MKDKKLIFLTIVFAFVYSIAFQQGLILLNDYLQLSTSLLVTQWQSYVAFFLFNLLAAQTTTKYFEQKHTFYFPVTVGIASALLPTLFALDYTQNWNVLLVNIVIAVIALIAQKKLEKLASKNSEDGNN